MNESPIHDYVLYIAGGIIAFWSWLTALVLALKSALADTRQEVAVLKAEYRATIEKLEDIKDEQREFRKEMKAGIERLHSRISSIKGGS